MIDILRKTWFKYLLFGSLYFTEGLAYMIASLILPIYLLDKGIPVSLVTLVAAFFLIPMTIKFIWGGIVDYFIQYGRRKFIILGGLFSFSSLVLLYVVNPSDLLPLFTLLLFISGVGVGFLDVSTDAWAIEISTYEERGKINGAMFAGQSAGMVVGSSVLTVIAQFYGYTHVFLITGLITLAIIIFPILVKDIKRSKKRQKIGRLLLGEFKKKTTQLVSIFTLLPALNIGLLGVVVPLYLNLHLHIDITHIGVIIAIWSATKIIGSIAGGAISDKWGRKHVLFVLLVFGIFFTTLLIFANTWQLVALLYGLIGVFHGAQYSVLSALLMDITNPKVGATQYSILTSIGNLGMTTGESSSGILVSMLGFTRTFLYGAWFIGPALLILYFIRLKSGKNEQRVTK